MGHAEQISSHAGSKVAKAPRSRPARSRAGATARLQAANQRLAEVLPLKQLNEVTIRAEEAAAMAATGEPAGTSMLTGAPLPSQAQLERIELANLQRGFAERRKLLQGALTVTQVATLMGSGRQTPHDRLRAATLLGIKDGGQWRFPAWQFDPNGPDGVVAGLPEVIKAMRGPISPLGRIKWFLTPKALLGGATPFEAMQKGRVAEVVAEAAALGAS
jgi:hypothetical protein